MTQLYANPIYDSLLHARQIVASDAHYRFGQFVSYRVDRKLRTETGVKIDSKIVQDFVSKELSDEQRERLDRNGYVDVGMEFTDRSGLDRIGRLRLNFRYAEGNRQALNLAVRFIPFRIFDVDEFDIGKYTDTLLRPHRGMDLIVAPMGMAKSSLRLALLNELNRRFGFTITSFEDPIEQKLIAIRGSVEQIEVGSDIDDFSGSDRMVRRTDTDLTSYGELRDRATKRSALASAKSMHVIATAHAGTAADAIDDYVEAFPPDEQSEIRIGLSQALHSIIVLRAVPRAEKRRLSPEMLNGRQNVQIVSEILHASDAVRQLIRKGESHRVRMEQQGPGREHGSRTLESHMAELVVKGDIDVEDPLVRREIRNYDNFRSEVQHITSDGVRRQR